MTGKLVNRLIKQYLRQRYERLEYERLNPHDSQQKILNNILHKPLKTKAGKRYGLSDIQNGKDYGKKVPLQDYESIREDVHSMMRGEADILWKGVCNYFAKSSGTTSTKSKYIPITKESLKNNHVSSSWDALAIYYHERPEALIFSEKSLLIGGSIQNEKQFPKATIGDVSAIMTKHLPMVARPFISPDIQTTLLGDWELKIQQIIKQSLNENIVLIGGVPTWLVSLFHQMLQETQLENIHDIWPNLSVYFHGGVNFEPYRDLFNSFLPKSKMDYFQVYNASEGYFAIQDALGRNDMLLLTGHGIYYEFLPLTELNSDQPITLPLRDVQVGVHYALVISSYSGLYRYQPGDTILFTSIEPYRIVVTGRTKQFINTFGEELMVSNAEKAIASVCHDLHCTILEYTVAPIYQEANGQGAHEWIIEFGTAPKDLDIFRVALDHALKSENSDYEAKRQNDLVLQQPLIHKVPQNTFYSWMKKRGKYGAQNKVPRLSNNRVYADELLTHVIKNQL